GRKNGQSGETPRGQWHGIDLGFFQNVAVGSVDSIHQGLRLHLNHRAHRADGQRNVNGGGSVSLHGYGGNLFALKTVVSKREGVGADGQVDEIVAAVRVAFLHARKL